jgi:hypothetical protein
VYAKSRDEVTVKVYDPRPRRTSTCCLSPDLVKQHNRFEDPCALDLQLVLKSFMRRRLGLENVVQIRTRSRSRNPMQRDIHYRAMCRTWDNILYINLVEHAKVRQDLGNP